MTFKELQDELVERADDPGISVASRKKWINDSYRELQTKGDWPWMVDVDESLTTVADQQEYAIPDNTEKIIEVKIGTNVYNRITYLDRNSYSSTDLPYVYYLKNATTFGFIPVPDATGDTIAITRKKEQDALDEDDDEPAFSALYHEMLVEGALERYWRREGNYAKAREHKANFGDFLVQGIANKTKPVVGEIRRVRHIREYHRR